MLFRQPPIHSFNFQQVRCAVTALNPVLESWVIPRAGIGDGNPERVVW